MVNAPALTPIDDLVAAFWSWMKDMHVAKVSISCNDGSLSCSSFGPDVIAAIVDERTALKAENERLTKALAVMEEKKISLQDDALPKWINRAEAAERALAERAGGVKVKQIDWLAEWMHRHDLRLVNAAFDELLAHLSALTTEPAAPEDDKPTLYETLLMEAGASREGARRLQRGSAAPEGRHQCATEGCGNPATNEFIRGDTGSFYCGDCFGKVIEVCETRTRPAEQAVTEAMIEAGAKAIVACRFEDESEPVTDYDLELSRAALKAAMEAGR